MTFICHRTERFESRVGGEQQIHGYKKACTPRWVHRLLSLPLIVRTHLALSVEWGCQAQLLCVVRAGDGTEQSPQWMGAAWAVDSGEMRHDGLQWVDHDSTTLTGLVSSVYNYHCETVDLSVSCVFNVSDCIPTSDCSTQNMQTLVQL